MKAYLSGPMSGIKSFNVPAFDAAAADLRAHGYEVVSPAELDGPEARAAIMASPHGSHADLPPGETWGFYLARDVRLLADDGIEVVFVLPDWAQSKGARLETFMAAALAGLPVYRYLPGIFPLTPRVSGFDLAVAWAGSLAELR